MTFDEECVYIHTLRLVCKALDFKYQALVGEVVNKHGGELKSAPVKGDQRMRNKALSEEDHALQPRPRPALNIDCVRCCATFEQPQALIACIESLKEKFKVIRVKNGFALDEAAAAQGYHYRSLMLNLLYEPGITYGQLAQEAQGDVRSMWPGYNILMPENHLVAWSTWRVQLLRAFEHLQGPALKDKPVRVVCEVQLLLKPYLSARKQMHFLYKVARSTSGDSLKQQFKKNFRLFFDAIKDSPKPNQVLWTYVQEWGVEVAKAAKADQVNQSLCNAIKHSQEEAVKLLLARPEVDVNAGNASPLYLAVFHGNTPCLRLLLAHKDIDVNAKLSTGDSILPIAVLNNRCTAFRELLQCKDIKVPGRISTNNPLLWDAVHKGHTDIAEMILKHGVAAEDLNYANDKLTGELKGTTMLWNAVRTNHYGCLQLLLAQANLDVNLGPPAGSPLFSAIMFKREEMVRAILAHKDVNVNIRSAIYQNRNCLIEVCRNGHAGILKLLLADPRLDKDAGIMSNGEVWTPLRIIKEHPAFNKHPHSAEFVRIMEEAGCSTKG